jgi:hypothetical protein
MHKQLFTKLGAVFMTALISATMLVPPAALASVSLPEQHEMGTLGVSVDFDCSNAGKTVTLGGKVVLRSDGHVLQLVQNDQHGVTVIFDDVVVLVSTKTLEWLKQMFTGNPRFTGRWKVDGKYVGNPFSMGACVQGIQPLELELPVEVASKLFVDLTCSNKSANTTIGGVINVTATIELEIMGTNGGGKHPQTKTVTLMTPADGPFPLEDFFKSFSKKEFHLGNPQLILDGQEEGRCSMQ